MADVYLPYCSGGTGGWGGSFGRMRSNNTKWVLSQRASGCLLAQNKRARLLTVSQSSQWDSKLEMGHFYDLHLVFKTLERRATSWCVNACLRVPTVNDGLGPELLWTVQRVVREARSSV